LASADSLPAVALVKAGASSARRMAGQRKRRERRGVGTSFSSQGGPWRSLGQGGPGRSLEAACTLESGVALTLATAVRYIGWAWAVNVSECAGRGRNDRRRRFHG
jgi:hypothetical protein